MEHIGFTDLPQPKGPNLVQMAVNLAKAVPDIVKSGVKIVPDNVYNDRMSLCHTCYFWNEDGNAGLGKCNHPKCGCTRGKMKLAASSCPINNWGAYNG